MRAKGTERGIPLVAGAVRREIVGTFSPANLRRKSLRYTEPSNTGFTGDQLNESSSRAILADVFALYLKTKNFHWHMDNNADYVDPLYMLSELREDNETFAARLRGTHDLCEEGFPQRITLTGASK